jgi:hypothetical protein
VSCTDLEAAARASCSIAALRHGGRHDFLYEALDDQKGGFYHDGRFQTLSAVVDHYNNHLKLNLHAQQKADLIEFLKLL